jgi:hypothetical protein
MFRKRYPRQTFKNPRLKNAPPKSEMNINKKARDNIKKGEMRPEAKGL